MRRYAVTACASWPRSSARGQRSRGRSPGRRTSGPGEEPVERRLRLAEVAERRGLVEARRGVVRVELQHPVEERARRHPVLVGQQRLELGPQGSFSISGRRGAPRGSSGCSSTNRRAHPAAVARVNWAPGSRSGTPRGAMIVTGSEARAAASASRSRASHSVIQGRLPPGGRQRARRRPGRPSDDVRSVDTVDTSCATRCSRSWRAAIRRCAAAARRQRPGPVVALAAEPVWQWCCRMGNAVRRSHS